MQFGVSFVLGCVCPVGCGEPLVIGGRRVDVARRFTSGSDNF